MRLLLTVAVASLSACTAASQPPPTVPPPPPCPVSSSSDWRAWVDATPGSTAGKPRVHVTGKVVLPYTNWEARFTTIRIMESSPVQAVVEMDFTTNSTEPKPGIPVEVRGEWPSEPRVGSVTVMCNGAILARIAPVETLY